MKNVILLIILYLMGVLFIVDISDGSLFPEEYFFNELTSDSMSLSVLISYFFIYIIVILIINKHLVEKNDKDSNVWFKWLSVSFLPLFMIAVFEYCFSLIGIIDYPQITFTIIQKLVLVFLVTGLFVFSVGYFVLSSERDRKINNYIYVFLNYASLVVLFYGLFFLY